MRQRLLLSIIALLICVCGQSQESYSLQQCLDYAVRNNQNLQKDRLSLKTAALSKQEVVGSLLPQINASGSFTDNIQKTAISMPNFVNSMLPEASRNPNAPKYMTVTMGMDYSANWGVSLSQQIINFSLYTAVSITNKACEMADLGLEMSTEDVIAQTASLYYQIQVVEYGIEQFDSSIELMDQTLGILKTNQENGLMRKVDVDRVTVSKTNLETERGALCQALEVQKNLLKLQMGFPVSEEISVETINVDGMEEMLNSAVRHQYDINRLLPFKTLKLQQQMLDLQLKSAKYETLPVVSLSANYSMNYMGDDFKGETFHKFPVSMVGLNLRMPIFTGMSKTAKVNKARIELQKSLIDEDALRQALTMSFNNAQIQLDQQLRNMASQDENRVLAEEVFNVTDYNFRQGIASLSDVLNTSSSLILSKVGYVNALNNSVIAYLELKKANGTIKELINNR